MNKKLIRLTESDLHKIVKQSVNKVLKEEYEEPVEYGSPLKMDMLNIIICAKKAIEEFENGDIDSKKGASSMHRLRFLCNKYVGDYEKEINDGFVTPYE